MLKCQGLKMHRQCLAIVVLPLVVCTYASFNSNSTHDACAKVEIWSREHTRCGCYSSGKKNVKIFCDGLRESFDKIEVNGMDIDTIEIENVTLDVLDTKLLIFATLKNLILRNVQAYLLFAPWYYGFIHTYRETLQMLEIYHSNLVFGWDFDQIGELKRLTHLVIADSNLYYITFNFRNLEGLEYLELRNVELKNLNENVFSHLYNLRLLSLSENRIKKLKRNMFPQPADYLWHLDFSHNQLEKLGSDLFVNMKQLKEIRLDHNKLKTLPERIFDPVALQLRDLWLHDNSLDCEEEKRKWMKHRDLPAYTWKAQCFVDNLR